MMSSEIEIEDYIMNEMCRRDREEQTETITKYKQLQDLLQCLDREVNTLKLTKETLADNLATLSLKHSSEIEVTDYPVLYTFLF